MPRKHMAEIRQQLQEDNSLAIYIYGDVEGDYFDWWTDREVVSETSADYLKDELEKYPDVGRIDVYINSYGGSVFEGTAIYNMLRRHKARVVAHIDGFACSIASVIAMAADEVIMPPNTLMMIHNMWMSAEGNAADLRKAADNLDVINAAGRAAYLDKAGEKLSEEELVRMMDAETWLTAADCLRLGLADRIPEREADMSQAGEILQKANERLDQRVRVNKAIAAQLRALHQMEQPEPDAHEEPQENADGQEAEPQEKAGKPGEEQQNQEPRHNTLFALFAKI